MRSYVPVVLVVLGVIAAGCGSDEEGVAPVELKEETADKLPPLPQGYEEYVNREGGVAFGRPPGWSAKATGPTTLLTAPDGLVSVTITVDRTSDALRVEPKDFATETIKLVPGFEEALNPKRAKPFEHEYQGTIAEADGVRKKDGLKQVVRVVVLERKGVAVVTSVIAENAEENAGAEAEQALAAVGTLRTRPPG